MIGLSNKNSARFLLAVLCIVMLAVGFTAARPLTASADSTNPPEVPTVLNVPEGSKLFFNGYAEGTQNFICVFTGTSYVWRFTGPQATLFDAKGEQVATHFLSETSAADTVGFPTWQHSQDTSAVWARVIAPYSGLDYVAPGAIPWLKLEMVKTAEGPTGGDRLTNTKFIQRVNTTGGLAPSTGCSTSDDFGKRAFVPYTADYFFYK